MSHSLVQELAAIAADGEQLVGAVAVVAAVNGDGTLRLTWRESTPDNIHKLTSYAAPVVGDVVLLLHGGGRVIVLGAIG